MKKLVLGLALALGAHGYGLDTDGCFQMYLPSVMYPVICVDGSNEEGIGGAQARVSLVGPNSLKVNYCDHTSSIRYTGDRDTKKVTFNFAEPHDRTAIYMEGVVDPKSGREEGTIRIGKTTLNYLRLLPADTKRVLDAVYQSGKCK